MPVSACHMGALRRLRRTAGGYDVAPLRPPGTAAAEQKMTEVILDFAGPVLDDVPDEVAFKNAVTLAIICWNISLLPEERQEDSLRHVVHDLGKGAHGDPVLLARVETAARLLLARKKAIYPNDRRIILSYKFVEEGDSTQLTVTFAMEAPPSTPGP